MISSSTLSRYLATRFLRSFISILAITLLLFFIVQLIELPRRAEGNYQASLAELMQLALFRLPGLVEQTMIFSVLYGSMWSFITLNRQNELISIWAVGVSVWQFLRAPMLMTVLIGLTAIMAFNPFAARMSSDFERLEAELRLRSLGQGSPTLESQGLWLQQIGTNGPSIIYAQHSTDLGSKLYKVIILRYEAGKQSSLWINADEAELIKDRWFLTNVRVSNPDGKIVFWDAYTISTNLTPARIMGSLSKPESISLWNLPELINLAETAGLPATRYKLQLQVLLSQPFLMCAMVLIAASFSMGLFRFENIVRMVLGGLLTGFLLFFANSWSRQIGGLEIVPVYVAAWFPALLAMIIGATAIFVQESR